MITPFVMYVKRIFYQDINHDILKVKHTKRISINNKINKIKQKILKWDGLINFRIKLFLNKKRYYMNRNNIAICLDNH